MMKLTALTLPISEILRLRAEDKLQIVHNPDSFEPYFYLVDEASYYSGDNEEYWDYISYIVELNIKRIARNGYEALGNYQAT